MDDDYHQYQKLVQNIRRRADEESNALEIEISSLKSQLSEITKQRDDWASDAKFVRDLLKTSEEQRHEAEAELETTQKQIAMSKSERAGLAKGIETKNLEIQRKDKLLNGEYEARMKSMKKKKAVEMELERYRNLTAEIIGLTSSFQKGGNGT